MAKQEIPLDLEIIFKEVVLNVGQKVLMSRNGICWNEKADKTMMRASMIELKDKLEIVGEFRGNSEVMDVMGVKSGTLYSERVVNEGKKVRCMC